MINKHYNSTCIGSQLHLKSMQYHSLIPYSYSHMSRICSTIITYAVFTREKNYMVFRKNKLAIEKQSAGGREKRRRQQGFGIRFTRYSHRAARLRPCPALPVATAGLRSSRIRPASARPWPRPAPPVAAAICPP
jgi:hypothetical protein